MKLSMPSLASPMPTKQTIKKRKKPSLPKGSGTDTPANPGPDIGKDIGKDSPPSLPKGGPTPTDVAPPNAGKDIPQSIPTNAAAVASDLGKDIPTSIPKLVLASSPTPAVTATVTSTTTVFSSISTTTIHHTETKTLTATGTGSPSASSSAPSGPIHAGDSLSGAALTDVILAQCPKTTNTLTSTVSVTPTSVTSMVTQTAISSALPSTITVTSTVTPQADRAPTCSALPRRGKNAGTAEIMAVVFGLITLALLVGMFFLAGKCYIMHRAQRVWRKQVRNEESELAEMGAGSGGGGAGVVVDSMAVHPARAALGQRLMDRLAKNLKRKEAWER